MQYIYKARNIVLSKETKEKKKKSTGVAGSLDEALSKIGIDILPEELHGVAYTFFVHGPEGNEIAGVLLGVSYFPKQGVVRFDVSNKYFGSEDIRGINFSFDKGLFSMATIDEEGYPQHHAGELVVDGAPDGDDDDIPSEEEALAAFARRKEPALARR